MTLAQLTGDESPSGATRAMWATALLCSLLVAALWVGILHQIDDERERAIATVKRNNENLVLAHSERIALLIADHDRTLRILRDQVQREGERFDLTRSLGALNQDGRHVNSMVVVDADGQVRHRWPVPAAPNVSDRDYFIWHRDHSEDRPRIGPPILGRVSGVWGVTLTRRISRPDGSFGGVVQMLLNPEAFTSLFEATDMGRNGALALIGTDGITRARRNREKVSFGEDISKSQLFKELPLRPAGSYIGVAASDGQRRIASYRLLEPYDMVVLVGAGYDEAVDALLTRNEGYYAAAATGTVLLAVLFLFTWLRSRADRKAVQRLVNSEARYRLLYESNIDGVMRLRPDGRVISANPAAQRIFGLKEDELRQRGFAALFDPKDQRVEALVRERDDVAFGGATALRGDGALIELELAPRSYIDENGEPSINVVFRDVTERRRLEQTQVLLLEILDASPDFIASADPQGLVTYLNRSARRLAGLKDNASTHRLEDFVPPSSRALLIEQALPAARASGGWTGETAIQLADGSEMPVLVALGCHRDTGGLVTHISLIARDIGPLRQAEQARRAQAVAEQANRAKSEFMSRVSHELRTPLNAILGFSQLLTFDPRRPLEADQRAQVEQIHRAGNHLLALIDDLLDISRLEAGTLKVQPEAIDALKIARESAAELQPLAAKYGIRVSVEAEGSADCFMLADRTRLRQVVLNLLSNAIKYGRGGGFARVAVRASGAETTISVSDNGIGMTPEQVGRLFQPFDRLGREVTRIEGSGMGLMISRRLTELMGGRLEVQSEAGVGSCFSLTLPAAAGLPGPVATATLPGRAVRNASVLYVDDEATNRDLMAGLFDVHGHLDLHLAEDGHRGLAAARQHLPDLILLDIRLPDLSGFEVLNRLRLDAATRDIPCIAVSAHAMPEEIANALTAGFDGYVTKPIEATTLFAEVGRVLGR